MHNRNYQYAKVFFRRPIWTSANIRMFIFLFLSAGFIFTLTFYSVRQSNFQAKKNRAKSSQHTYMKRLIKLYEGQTADATAVSYGTWYPAAGSGSSEAVPHSGTTGNETAADANQASASDVTQLVRMRGDSAADIVRKLRSPDQTKTSVEQAIEDVSYPVRATKSRIDQPLEAYTARRKAYSSANEQIGSRDNRRSLSDNASIAINGANLTDFDIVEGVRDYEQTIAVAKTNERRIKVCIDRQYRLNPLFKGSLVVQFDIHPQGHVLPESIRILSSDIHDSRVTNCITRNIRRWKNFPQVPYQMGKYTITQKYVF